MKLFLSVTIVTALILASSCKKNEDNQVHGLGAILLNTWSVGDSVHRATSVHATGAQLVAVQVNGSHSDTLTFRFNGAALPLTAGKYKIVASNPGPDQIVVSATNNSGTTYTATGNDNAYANVFNAHESTDILGDYIGISIPAIWAKSGGTGLDSIKISGAVARK